MLELPKFIQGFITSLAQTSNKFSAITGMMDMLKGKSPPTDGEASPVAKELEQFYYKMKSLDEVLHDSSKTEFTVVTIPTEVALAETMRLIQELGGQNVAINHIMINQVLTNLDQSATTYLEALRNQQSQYLTALEKLTTENNLPLLKVPFHNLETRTTFGLRLVADNIFPSPV
jgi:arsenite-transporting ATPase